MYKLQAVCYNTQMQTPTNKPIKLNCRYCGKPCPPEERYTTKRGGRLVSYAAHVPCYRQAASGSWDKNKEERNLAWVLSRRYGISLETFKTMLAAQDSTCAICKAAPEPGRRLSVDHCHTTGLVRGLLCQRCNTAVGMAQDRPELLRQMADYVEKSSKTAMYNEPEAV